MGWFTNDTDDVALAMQAIEDALRANDKSQAWTATWDLISLNDHQAKSDAVAMLRPHIAAGFNRGERATPTDAKDGSTVDTAVTTPVDAEWQRARLAVAIEEAILHSSDRSWKRLLSSREVRKHGEREQARRFQEAVADLGVRPGEGLPAWLLYMSRRNRKSWG